MKGTVRTAAMAAMLAAFVWPAGRASAVCSTSLSDPACAVQLKCANTITSESVKYVAAIQKVASTMITNSQAGKNTTAQLYTCVGGPQAGKKCLGNNGGCSAGTLKGAACNDSTDCGGSGVCNFGSNYGCNSTVPTSVNGNLDEFECQPNSLTSVFSKDAATAEKNLKANIKKKCQTLGVTADEIGLGHIAACPDAATAGTCVSVAGTPKCTQNSQCTAGTCVANDTERYNALFDCVLNSADGDFNTGKVQDTYLRVFDKISGSGNLPPVAKAGPADPIPRQILQLSGSNTLQIGAGAPANTDNSNSSGGGVTTISLAHCVGGSARPACLNNADCGTGGVCTRNTAGVGVNVATGPTNVHKCCNTPGIDAGTSCALNGDCSSNDCSINTNCLGNILTVTQTNNSTGSFCLVTHTRNAGGTGTQATGTVNLTTGDYLNTAPILTDVNGGPCPTCDTSGCTPPLTQCCSNDGTKKCTTVGSISQECLPTGSPIASVPNPFTLSTGTVTLTASTVVGSPNKCGFCDVGGADGVCNTPPCPFCLDTSVPCSGGRVCDSTTLTSKAFCGFCSDFINQGCQTTADCVAAGHAGPCSFTGALPGAHGDCSVSQIVNTGEANLYGEVTAGAFCTGKTGNGLVDGSAALPGPVRVKQPYIMGYVVSKDK